MFKILNIKQFIRASIAVLCAFFGVRKKQAHEIDFLKLNPVHVILLAFIFTMTFIAILLIVVKAVLS